MVTGNRYILRQLGEKFRRVNVVAWIFVVAMSLFASCQFESPKGLETLPHDSLMTDTVPLRPLLRESFPDTMYASAAMMTYVVDTFDKTISPMLSDYDDLYANASGVFMFRGSPSRNPNFSGRLRGDSLSINVKWVFSTDRDTSHTEYGVWGGGNGWTGQPLYVNWSDSMMRVFRQHPDSLTNRFNAKEIIVASLCGKMYFIDFESGKPSRQPVDLGNVVKGTPSINPMLNGHVYVGHGVPNNNPFGSLVFDLFSHSIINTFGSDWRAWRGWGAYDSSPVVVGGFVFRPGENGTIYKAYVGDGGYRLHSTMRYSLRGTRHSPGIESSLAVCRNYGYFADNDGNVVCINLNTLKPVWHYGNLDDTDASIVVDVEGATPYVYSGCEVDNQGEQGVSRFVKLNGLDGSLVWADTIPCNRVRFTEKNLDGGMFASPLLGDGDCKGMIFSNFCVNSDSASGYFMAFDKENGEILYRRKTRSYCWSSPVAFYNARNEMFVFTADIGGYVYLIKAKTGEIVASKRVGVNFEASPVVADDYVVIGSRGNKIYKISLE